MRMCGSQLLMHVDVLLLGIAVMMDEPIVRNDVQLRLKAPL